MRRLSVVGPSGAGKTTLAAATARRLDVAHIELDALFHGPDWQPPDPAVFRRRVEAALGADAWVVCGNYSVVQPLVWSRADTVVVLDLPRWLVMVQVVRRSLWRVVTRRRLWNDNRERWRNLVAREPAENIVLWAWTNHPVLRERYRAAAVDPRWSALDFVFLRSRHDVRRWLDSLS